MTGGVMKEVKANKMLLTETGKYQQKGGKQKLETCAGGLPKEDVLESSWFGGAEQQTGLSVTYTRTNEEAMEVNTVAGPEPEYGRCVKAIKPPTGYTNSGCTKSAQPGAGNYEWLPGPGPKPGYTLTGGPVVIETVFDCEKTVKAGGKYAGEYEDKECKVADPKKEGKYELHGGPREAMTCTSAHGSGVVVSDDHTGGAASIMVGCKSNGSPDKTEGAAEGEVVWEELKCRLGVSKASENSAKEKVGEICEPAV